MNPKLEAFREKRHPTFGTTSGTPWGLFWIPVRGHKSPLKVLCSPMDGKEEWEHVSVSLPDRCPTWDEMCVVKVLFWGLDARVVQFHPPQSEYVNNCKHCLHLWLWTRGEFPHPPKHLVGIQGAGVLA